MTQFGPVTGNVIGPVQFSGGSVSFSQGAAGANLIMKKDTNIWYVDSGQSASGNGKTPKTAFITLLEAVNAAGDYDTILVMPNAIETIASGGIVITQEGLRILGPLADIGLQNAAFKISAGTDPMFTITASRVEIANLHLSCRIAYPAICIGSVTLGVGTAIYQTHIHDCNITGYNTATFGVAMGGAGGFGVATQCDAVNAVIEHNKFTGFATAAVVVSGTRMTVKNNEIDVAVDTTGVTVPETGSNRGFWKINDNSFVGISGSTSKAIYFAGNTTAGQGQVLRNVLAGTWNVTITTNTGKPCVLNYSPGSDGATLVIG